MKKNVRKAALAQARSAKLWWDSESRRILTWDHVPGIQGVLVLDEAEAVHQLDLSDLPGAMFSKVGLDVGLGGFCYSSPGRSGQQVERFSGT